MSRNGWLTVSIAAGLLVVGGVVLVKTRKPQAVTQAAVPAPDNEACRAPKTLSLMPLPAADDPPAIIWATGDVRLELNDAVAFAPPDAPVTLKTGPHSLKVDGKLAGREQTRFRVMRSTPAFFFATVLKQQGLVLVRFGTLCESCEPPTNTEELVYKPGRDSTAYLLKESAKLLRAEKWTEARDLLRAVPPKDRASESFRLIAAALFGQANQNAEALAQLKALAKDNKGSPVAQVLSAFEALKVSERSRREKVLMQRWNKLTDRFAGLVARFEPEVRGAVEGHSRRLEALSSAFAKAAETKDVLAQEDLVRAAHGLLEEFVEQIRAQRPDDCDFQTKVVAAALQ